MILGITGAIGSGKSTVASIFAEYGFKVIDADKIAHDILNNNKIVINKLKNVFGKRIFDINGKISREKLGGIVFNDKSKLKKLNLIMHPVIISNIKKAINQSQKIKNIVIDAPLLLETKTKNLADKIMVVMADKKTLFERAKKQNKFSKSRLEKIIKLQMPLKEKIKYADLVIDNNKSIEELKKQIKLIIGSLNNI